ncbi:hypothetical protein WJX73_009008 [Symbiochloris irregularis]|uniref:Uncharacterized protein n=1 Tax=Symbiochloris irregularis TaxID=706552 RepID=A0AAW1NPP0_9CHLO
MGTVVDLEGIARDLQAALGAAFAGIRDQKPQEDSTLLLLKAASLLARTKGASQAIFEKSEELKRGSTEAQSALNGTWMELENLLWERDFLRGEVAANANFRSQFSDADIELSPEALYLQQATTAQATEDAHELMKQRLANERDLRIAAAKALEVKRAQRDALAGEVAQKRKFIDSLSSHMQMLQQGSDAACLALGIPPVANAPQPSRHVSLLPQPLFTIYWQMLSAASAFDLALQVSIAGSVEEAVQWREKALKQGEGDPELSRRRTDDEPTSTSDTLLQEHPLRVEARLMDAVGDDGVAWPSEASVQLLGGARGEGPPPDQRARPYRWAQWLAGLDLLPPQPSAATETDESSHTLLPAQLLPETLQTYRGQQRACVFVRRWRAVAAANEALRVQLSAFAQGRVALVYPPTVVDDKARESSLDAPPALSSGVTLEAPQLQEASPGIPSVQYKAVLQLSGWELIVQVDIYTPYPLFRPRFQITSRQGRRCAASVTRA